MNRKQAIKITLSAVLLGALLCACGAEDNSAVPAASDVENTASSVESEITEPQSPSATEAKDLTDGEAYVYFGDKDSFMSVSRVASGKQLLSGEKTLSVDGDIHYFSAQELSAQGITYVEAENSTGNLKGIAANGTWDFYPEAVDCQSYTLTNQPDNAAWTDYFQKRLNELGCDAPLVFRESASFSWNGLETGIVTVSNAVPSESAEEFADAAALAAAQNPANSAPSVYTISAVFVSGREPQELYSRLQEITKAADSMQDIYYVTPGSEDLYLQPISAIQYDTFGNAAEFPVYAGMTGELLTRDFRLFPSCLVADVDGDGVSEILFEVSASSGTMCRCEVLKLKDGSAERALVVSFN